FSPRAVPRCVEAEGVLSTQRAVGAKILETVYGFTPDLAFERDERVEFSVHPVACGFRERHTVIWEVEALPPPADRADYPTWPNNFSRTLGDKAFGLLVSHIAGLPVPKTTVIPRYVPLFNFGTDTGSGHSWLRTSPAEPQPGQYTTVRGWIDPFRLLHDEDPSGEMLQSVVYQQEVKPVYSG